MKEEDYSHLCIVATGVWNIAENGELPWNDHQTERGKAGTAFIGLNAGLFIAVIYSDLVSAMHIN